MSYGDIDCVCFIVQGIHRSRWWLWWEIHHYSGWCWWFAGWGGGVLYCYGRRRRSLFRKCIRRILLRAYAARGYAYPTRRNSKAAAAVYAVAVAVDFNVAVDADAKRQRRSTPLTLMMSRHILTWKRGGDYHVVRCRRSRRRALENSLTGDTG